jgi:hypothetical protein
MLPISQILTTFIHLTFPLLLQRTGTFLSSEIKYKVPTMKHQV